MRFRLLIFFFALNSATLFAQQSKPAALPDCNQQVRQVVEQFEAALKARDLKKIESVMAEDLVALENGHRNDGWADFRDNHLVPEMQDPEPPSTREIIRVTATEKMGWAYSKTTLAIPRAGKTVNAELWSVYILEKRGEAWKIVVLDWSMRTVRQ